jgi:predicted O-methyltransferase YrrM
MPSSVQRLRREISFLTQLRVLPPRVALFQWRAWRLAVRSEDAFALVSATRPRNLAVLLRVARACPRVVELGTGSAWTAISLALADRERVVVSYDPIERPERERYLRLVGPGTRGRLTFVGAPGNGGPRGNETIDLLYIDSSHEREETIREVHAWRGSLKEGSLIIFDDFAHEEYRGVAEAIRCMGIRGEQREGLFVHRVSNGAE